MQQLKRAKISHKHNLIDSVLQDSIQGTLVANWKPVKTTQKIIIISNQEETRSCL